MFGTLRYDSQSNDTEFVDGTYGFLLNDADTQATPHFACDTCRMKKLKCSGQRTGCDRCKAMSNSCVYSPTGDATNGRRRKHGGDRPSAKSQRLTSPSQSSSAGRPSKSLASPKAPPPVQPRNFQNEDFGDPAMDDSPTRTFEEEFGISDEILYGMIPEFGPQGSEGFVQSSGSPSQMGLKSNSSSMSGPIATETTITVDSSTRIDSQSSATSKSDSPASYPNFASSSRLMSTHSESLPPEHTAYRESRKVYPSPITPTRQTDRTLKTMTSSPDPPATCRCFQTLISILEELENESDLIGSSGLDSVLAFHKGALAQCKILLRCMACMAMSEHPLLLVLVCERLVDFCEKMVNEHLRRPQGQVKFLAENNSSEDGNVGSAHHQQKISVGKYGVDLPVEFDCILKVLMALQLKALEGLLIEVRKTVLLSLHGTRVSKFLSNEQRLKALAEKLQRPEDRARQQHRASPRQNE